MTGSFHTIVTHGGRQRRDVVDLGLARARPGRGRGHSAHPRLCRGLPHLTWPVDGAADRPLRADHAPGGARRAAPRTGARSSSCSRAGCPRAGGTASSPASAGRSTRSSAFRFDDDEHRPAPRARRRRRARPSTGWPTTGSPATSGATPRARPTSPTPRCWSSRRRFAEAVLLETVLLSIYNHDSAIASAASRMTWAAGRPAVHRDGLAAHARGGRGRGRPGGVRRRLRRHLQPRGPAAVRRPDRRHQRALLHAAARHRGATRSAPRSASLGTGTTLLVDTYDVAEAVRLGVEVAGPELGAVRLDSGDLGVLAHAGARRSSTRSARPRPGSSSPPTSTSTRSPRSRRRPSTATASAPRWSPAAATRPAASSTSWSPARATDGAMVGGREEEQGQDLDRRPQVRPAPAARPTASPRPRWSASARRRTTTATTGALLVPLVRDGEVVGRETLDDARERHAALARRAAAGGPPALQRRAGHPDRAPDG